MNIGSFNSDSIGTLLSSLPGSQRGNTSAMTNMYQNLNELASVKSGSYYKLARSYYAKENEKTSEKTDKKTVKKENTSTSKSSTKELAEQEKAATELIESSKALYKSNSLWKKDDEGNYNRDKIYQAVSKFIDDYNQTIKESASSEVTGIAHAAAALVNANRSNSSLLDKIGISMDSSNYKLSISEETFKKADIGKIKSLFSGTGSYAYQMGAQASMIQNYAQLEASKANTYTKGGSFGATHANGSIYDSIT